MRFVDVRPSRTRAAAAASRNRHIAAAVARFVGHSDVATTRGYVQPEGDRPTIVSLRPGDPRSVVLSMVAGSDLS